MHRDNITCLVFSKPTNFLITGSSDGHIKFWKKKDQGLASASQAIPGNSTGSRANADSAESIKHKAKAAQEKGEDLTFLGESIEFVKQYRSHLMSVDYISLSKDGLRACTICTAEMSLKIFDVLNFDMISMFKFKHLRPIRAEFLYLTNEDKKLLIGCGQLTGRVEFIDTEYLRYESSVTEELKDYDQNGQVTERTHSYEDEHERIGSQVGVVGKDNTAAAAENQGGQNQLVKISDSVITCMLYHAIDQIVILFHLDGAINFLDIETRKLSTIKLKDHPDLYNLQKEKTFALSGSVNAKGTKFAIQCNDKSVRVYNYLSGKQIAKFNESIDSLRKLQSAHSPPIIDLMEFEQRVLQETKLDNEITKFTSKNQAPNVNLCSSVHFYSFEDDDLLVYSSMIGIRIFSFAHKRIVTPKPIGVADNVRSTLLACGFDPICVAKKATNLDSLSASNPALLGCQKKFFNKKKFFYCFKK